MRPPDKVGLARVWQVRLTPELERAHDAAKGFPSASLGEWIVNGPYHPFWSWWYVGLVHLRDLPGAPPAEKRYPEAEHELLCFSLDPEPRNGRPATPDVDKLEAGDLVGGMPSFLQPPDWVVQFHGVDDDGARRVAERVIDQIVAGRSCDSDYRRWWREAIPQIAREVAAA